MTHKEREKVVIVSRALDIAAELFAAEKYCLFDDEGKCRKQEKNHIICGKCLRSWFMEKAKKELELK